MASCSSASSRAGSLESRASPRFRTAWRRTSASSSLASATQTAIGRPLYKRATCSQPRTGYRLAGMPKTVAAPNPRPRPTLRSNFRLIAPPYPRHTSLKRERRIAWSSRASGLCATESCSQFCRASALIFTSALRGHMRAYAGAAVRTEFVVYSTNADCSRAMGGKKNPYDSSIENLRSILHLIESLTDSGLPILLCNR